MVVSLVSALVAAVGLYLAHSIGRNTKLGVAQPRRAAYSRLWEITGVAAPTRLDGWGDDGTLSAGERLDLWEAMTDWYYQDGNGMLLADRSKGVYLNVKHDLVCSGAQLKPAGLHDRLVADREACPGGRLTEAAHGVLAARLLSLLRTQLKADLRIYGPTYSGRLRDYERYFLEESGVDLSSTAWARAANLRWPWTRARHRWAWWRGRCQEVDPPPAALTGLHPVLDSEVVGPALLVPRSSRHAVAKARDLRGADSEHSG